jgi:hypothetical protein
METLMVAPLMLEMMFSPLGDDVVTFFFHTYLVYGLDLGGVVSSFTSVGNLVR